MLVLMLIGKTHIQINVYFRALLELPNRRFAHMPEKILMMIMIVTMIINMVILMKMMTKITEKLNKYC